jgi:hypothetical protein
MNQRVGVDFFQARIQTDVPKRMVPTSTWTVRECPVCHKWARTLVKPSFNDFQSEICVDFCEGDKKYPSAYVSFRGSWIQDGHVVVETLRGSDGKDGRDGLTPTREELVGLLKEVLREQGFWRRLFGRIK